MLLFLLTCTFLNFLLLMLGSVYLFWSWRHNKEKASQHAEHLRELRDTQLLQSDIIQSMEKEREDKERARKSLDGTPSTEAREFASTYPNSYLGVTTW